MAAAFRNAHKLSVIKFLTEVKDFEDKRLAILNQCLEGGALVWWQSPLETIREDWDEASDAICNKYEGGYPPS